MSVASIIEGWKELVVPIANMGRTLQALLQAIAPAAKASGTATVTDTTSTSLIAAVPNNRVYVSSYTIANSGATPAVVTFQSGSGGTALWADYIAATSRLTVTAADVGLPLFGTASGAALFFAASASSTSIIVSASGYAGQ